MPHGSQIQPGWDRFYGGLLLTRRRGAYDLSVLERLRRVRERLDAHPEEPLDLEAMARAACFSKFHFLRLFRQAYGETPGRYLAQARLERARRLLEASEGVLGGGAFDTDDCAAAYEALKSRGVQFSEPPKQQVYGLATTFTDDSGNFFSLTQP